LPLTDVVLCPRFHDDYLGQQCTKLHADLLTDADWIFHMDSDCVVAQPFRPDDLIQAGRGRQFVTRHRDLPERHPWKSCTSRFLGIDPGYDFMRRFPIPYPRWLYSQVREFCQHRHGVSLETYVTRQPPRGFSEFNALGGYAYLHYPNAFEWVDEGGDDNQSLPHLLELGWVDRDRCRGN
jgi:hypothetical protein